jgi:hypothetical protein
MLQYCFSSAVQAHDRHRIPLDTPQLRPAFALPAD